jgi:hypothetical protein
MAYCVDTRVHIMEAARSKTHLDPAPTQPERTQLPPCHDPVLALCQFGDAPVNAMSLP